MIPQSLILTPIGKPQERPPLRGEATNGRIDKPTNIQLESIKLLHEAQLFNYKQTNYMEFSFISYANPLERIQNTFTKVNRKFPGK